jgi:serine/threonine-protein kinase
VLYELLTGRPPFTGDSPVAIAYQHVREEPIPPSQVDPNIPHWCDPIVLKAMAKDANDRYQSANEFRADIQRALQGQPVSATASSTMVMSPGTQVMPPPTTVDRHPGYAQTQAGQHGGYEGPPGYDDYDDERRRGGAGKKVALWVALAVLFIGGAGLVGVLMSGGGSGGNKASNTPSPSASGSATPSANQVTVPTDLVGKTKDDATNELKGMGLTVSVTSSSSSTVPKNQVMSSDPSGGTSVDKGSSVTLTVSSGPANQPVNVPDVTGNTFGKAKSTLQDAGLKVSRGPDQSSDTVPKGQVISTNPPAGTSVQTNSTVTVTVSSGSQTVTVPDVTHGFTPKAACDKIKAAGLQCVEQDQPTPGVTTPTVTGQNPQGGTTAARNETVTITVATPMGGGQSQQPNG